MGLILNNYESEFGTTSDVYMNISALTLYKTTGGYIIQYNPQFFVTETARNEDKDKLPIDVTSHAATPVNSQEVYRFTATSVELEESILVLCYEHFKSILDGYNVTHSDEI